MLDPGHGWSNIDNLYSRPITTLKDGKAIILSRSMCRHEKDGVPGYYREDFGTLAIAKGTKEALEDMDYEVHVTRSFDDDLGATAHLAEELNGNPWQKGNWKSWKWIREATSHYKCDAFVSIHTNAGGGTGSSGFYAEDPGRILSETICNEINNKFHLGIRRISEKRYLILRDSCHGKACLIECAFHDHPKDLALLLDQNNLIEFGKAIARGTDKFLSSV